MSTPELDEELPANITFVRAEDLLAESIPTEFNRSQQEISRSRKFLTGFLGLLAVVGLTALLNSSGGDLSNEGKVLLYLPIVAGVAVFGGIFVGVSLSVISAVTINYYFLEPIHSLTVAREDQAVSLAVFIGISVLISGLVEVARRRGRLARETVLQAETLSELTRPDLEHEESVGEVLERARLTFGMESVVLKERDSESGKWVDVEMAGWSPPSGSAPLRFDVPMGSSRRLVGRGPELFANDERILRAFADAVATARSGLKLSARAREAGELAAVDRQRTALLAAVGHDLRTPISGIKASVGTLTQQGLELSDEDRSELLASIRDSSDRLDGLVGNLLDASRLQAGGVVVSAQATALDEVVARAVLATPGAGPRVQVEVPDDLPLVLADPGLLERVFFNLIDNAMKHGGDGQITVSAFAGDTSTKIEVSDSGPGVTEEQRGRLFEPFEGGTDRSSSGGLGLGLSIAKGFIEAMDGAMVADTAPTGGLTIRIRLPLAS